MKNRKIILTILLVLSVLCLTSCLSTMLTSFIANTKVDIPFSGSMDTRYSYENLSWGTSYKNVVNAGYPLTASENKDVFFCYIGENYRYYDEAVGKYYDRERYFGHGDVNSTVMYFINKKLSMVIDSFLTTPSLDYLHQRYGDFDETNIVTDEQREEKVLISYSNASLSSLPTSGTLFINIYESGKCEVTVCEEYSRRSYSILEMIIKENKTIGTDVWICNATVDPSTKKIDLTFINKNKDGKCIFIGYSKDPENPVLSYVRAGICWMSNTSGTYEIKLGTNIETRSYSTSTWNCRYDGKQYTYTKNSGESARTMLDLFLNNEKITIRHNNTVSEFNSDAIQLVKMMNLFGVSLEELDAAIANEEF